VRNSLFVSNFYLPPLTPIGKTMKKLSLKIVSHTDRLFWSGRRLVRNVYGSTWGTEPDHLCDDYDFAVLICDRDEVKGNLNIKLRTAGSLLPSEKYFRPRHWESQCPPVAGKVGEICSLAVCDSLTNRERILVLNGLILGTNLLAMHHDIELFATVQRTALIHTLVRLMRYPFFASEDQTLNTADLPDDKYWTTEPMPRLYYVLSDAAARAASFRLLCSFLANGLSIEGIAPVHAVRPANAAAAINTAEAELAA
jgi:hypothetical protein